MGQAIRVYVLAHERQVDSQAVVQVARCLGFNNIGSALATLDPQQRTAVEKALDVPPPPDGLAGVIAPLPPRNPAPLAAYQMQPPANED